ncbi:MAG: hypothetical protein MRQ10_05985 [Candidatus Midichloria mitochondrii]|nr:hypothetical protein [Candidatus Midichloria mitochondrii]
MPNPAHHGIARQTISWQTSFSGLLAYVFKPNISRGKNRLTGILLTSN